MILIAVKMLANEIDRPLKHEALSKQAVIMTGLGW